MTLCLHIGRLYTQIYLAGVMGKSYHNHGGGVNFLCLPLDPFFPGDSQATGGDSYVYGVEYRSGSSFAGVYNDDVPCAVCEVQGRSQVLMVPAKPTCPDGWTLEYEGVLASQHQSHTGSEFVCVSSGMEAIPGGEASNYGGLLYQAEAVCGPLQCPPYEANKELRCAVCTK